MIKVRYERYYNDNYTYHESKNFNSMEELADFFFGLVQGEYNGKLTFVDPESPIHNDPVDPKLNSSCIRALGEKYIYYIHQIEKDGAIIYSCGTFTNGICHWNEEAKQWLRDCRERVERPQFNFARNEDRNTNKMDFTDLYSVLGQFSEFEMKGAFSKGRWKIAHGNNDSWFDVYYDGEPVARCVGSELESNFGLEEADEKELLKRITSVYSNLKIKQEKQVVKGDTSDFEKYVPSDDMKKAVEILNGINREKTLPFRLALMMLEIEENAPDLSLKEKMFLTERLLDSCYSSDVAIHSGERTWALSDLLSEGITENRNYYRAYDLPVTAPEKMKEALMYCYMDEFTNLIDYVAIQNSKHFLDDPTVEYFYDTDVMKELENTVKTTKKSRDLDDVIESAEKSKIDFSTENKIKEEPTI